MMREYQVRICERLGVKFPGPTRQQLTEMMHRREPAVRARSDRRDSTHPEVASPTFFGLKEFTVEISIQIEARL
jgi:hypothetical protein